MRVTKIEVKKDCKKMTFGNLNQKLFPVTITAKNWLGKEKVFNAYPTNYGPTYGSETIIFFYFSDENGKELNDDLSKQINNWLLKEDMNGTLPS
ncbi:MAG: hypothetical protein JST71_04120 [Bacteroidetes bacterium]|nr:hypothetical protein [Bacteroidota bacterium]